MTGISTDHIPDCMIFRENARRGRCSVPQPPMDYDEAKKQVIILSATKCNMNLMGFILRPRL